MVLPLLLGLGLLAGNEYFRQKAKDSRDQALADKYAGLLGASPGEMGPPDESGRMGYSGGRGLLADPTSIDRQMQFASGVTQIPRQQQVGLTLLNAAMQRAQAQDESRRQAQQWGQQFGLQQRQFEQGQKNYEQTFTAGRDDAAAMAQRFGLTFGLQQQEAARAARQWGLDFGLRQRAEDRADQLAADKGDALPKLPPGYMYQASPDGGAIAAPIPGTPDHVKGTQGLAELQRVDGAIGNFLDLMAGKETLTRQGRKVRIGGTGTEAWGDNAQRLASMRGAIIASVARMRDMGVLDKNEYERLDEQLPDPTGWTSLGKRSRNAEIAYEQLRSELRTKLEAHLEAHPWLLPAVPKGFVPEGKAGQPAKPRAPPAAPGGPAGPVYDPNVREAY